MSSLAVILESGVSFHLAGIASSSQRGMGVADLAGVFKSQKGEGGWESMNQNFQDPCEKCIAASNWDLMNRQCFVPYMWYIVIFTMMLEGRYLQRLYFTEEETEVQQGEMS